MVGQLSEGMVLKPALNYRRIAATKGVPRDNH
jgi:dihydroxy-acid dehydratase